MKIIDRLPVAPPRPPSPPRAADRAGAFEALLRSEDQARGFQDLGMFGRRPGADHPLGREAREESEASVAAPSGEAASSPILSSPTPQAAPRLAAYAEAVVQALAPETFDPAAPGPVSTSVTQIADPGADAVVHPFELAGIDESAGPEGAAPVVQRVRLATGSGLSLVVADHQGALRVAIGGLAGTPAALARLRLKIAELAIEFGLHLSELSVNGDRLEVSTRPIPGGAHGHHAR